MATRLMLLCDHASNKVPAAYANLGLSRAELGRHISYDIGAGPLTVALSARLGAPAVMGGYSRLLIDPNRGESDPSLILAVSDGTIVPGNASIDRTERERRIALYYAPYHAAVEGMISDRLAAGQATIIVSIHSFTPLWDGESRPWHVGVLWDADPVLARGIVERLGADPELIVGENEPYSGSAPTNSTLRRHAELRRLPHLLLEIRQDLIADQAGVEAWADRLAPILGDL